MQIRCRLSARPRARQSHHKEIKAIIATEQAKEIGKEKSERNNDSEENNTKKKTKNREKKKLVEIFDRSSLLLVADKPNNPPNRLAATVTS